MSAQVVNICHGWGCPRMTKCAKSDYNAPPIPLQTWSRHYQATTQGDNCPDFVPLPPPNRQPFGYGPELER